jgi:Toprim-like/DNA primase catalytic core, N-terminal domain
VADFYARTFWNDPRAMTYLQKRKCFHPEAAKLFQIGYANRTLGYRVPTTTAAGNSLKSRLQALGVMRKETGHEHLSGSVVFPICDPRSGHVVQLYGRKITDGLRKGTPLHLYLERPKSGLWNGAALATQREIILCESVIDALTFWCAGFRNVTCTFGAGSVNDDLIALLQTAQPRWVILAQDNDPAGNEAAAKLAARLAEMSIGTKRLPLPPGCDVNAFACQSGDASRALAGLLEEAQEMGSPLAVDRSPWQSAAHEQANLQRPHGVAAGHRSGSADVSAHQTLPEGGDVCLVGTGAEVGGVGGIEHRGGSSEGAPEGVYPAPELREGQPRGTAHADDHRPAAGLPDSGGSGAVRGGDGRSGGAAQRLDQQAGGSADVTPEIKGEDIFFHFGERHWRIRGLAKNLSFEALRVQVRLTVNGQRPTANEPERFHLDTRDLLSAKQRESFLREAAAETHQREDILKRDLGRILLKLEDLQEANIRRATEPQAAPAVGLSAEEHAEAMALLTAPDLMEIIPQHGEESGCVGEGINFSVGYLGVLSRQFDKPLGLIIQSTSAAGKTTLMDALLGFVPEEDVIKYSAMTGQALFYLGEQDIRHKVLAIAEEEGAEKATYALKLLQSEGQLTIASTGKDATTGRMETQTYHVQGPAMILFTTTNVDLDEEYANRCLILSVDESREQTRRIHQLQRDEETIEGHIKKQRAAALQRLHQNAQRLLQPIPVHNPFAKLLTFPDGNTRLRRDQKKYLTLIRAIAFLHQHQRLRRSVQGVEHIEVTLDDIAHANRLAGEVLGRSLDEMPPQTRRFLNLIHAMVTAVCTERQIEPKAHRFTQRDVRDATGHNAQQVKRHLAKLCELEYLLTHRGGRGQSFVYELLYHGEGHDGSRFLAGLIDVEKLRSTTAYDSNRDIENAHRDTPNSDRDLSGSREGHGWDTVVQTTSTAPQPSKINGSSAMMPQNAETAQPGKNKKSDEIKVVTVTPAAS